MENLDAPFFGDDVDGYLKWLHTNNISAFKFVVYRMSLDRLGLKGAHIDSGGSCTSTNCTGTTGCTAKTTNGYCACQGPDGPCTWVPAV